MRWDAVIQAVSNRAAEDAALIAIFGTTIRKSGRQAFAVPSLEYLLVSVPRPGELWAPCTIQFDIWTETLDDTVAAAVALDRLFDHDRVQIIEGVYMWAHVSEPSVTLEGPLRENQHGQASRFRFVPIRAKLLPGRT